MAMLIEVDREERVSGVGCRPRPSAEREVRSLPLERHHGLPGPGEVPGGAAPAEEREREWPWLLSAGVAAFLIVLLLGLFGPAVAPAGGGAAGEIGPGDTREIGSGPVEPAGGAGSGVR